MNNAITEQASVQSRRGREDENTQLLYVRERHTYSNTHTEKNQHNRNAKKK